MYVHVVSLSLQELTTYSQTTTTKYSGATLGMRNIYLKLVSTDPLGPNCSKSAMSGGDFIFAHVRPVDHLPCGSNLIFNSPRMQTSVNWFLNSLHKPALPSDQKLKRNRSTCWQNESLWHREKLFQQTHLLAQTGYTASVEKLY
jgi:hypothetical protein